MFYYIGTKRQLKDWMNLKDFFRFVDGRPKGWVSPLREEVEEVGRVGNIWGFRKPLEFG